MVHTDRGTPFARRMYALKVRSNRSYEALARRIGVSSSTLHRYCGGETVPPRFDVVARFARACGASRAELDELLRLWASTGDRPPARKERGDLVRARRPDKRVATWLAATTAVAVLGAALRRHRATVSSPAGGSP